MASEQQNRELKAVRIEDLLVAAGHRRLTPEAREDARKARITASKATWDTVERFLEDRFPNG